MNIILYFLIFFTFALQAQEQSKTDKIDEYMQAAVKAWNFSGAVLIAEKDTPSMPKEWEMLVINSMWKILHRLSSVLAV